jgi:uncharacterized protein (DUF488 family)
MTIYTIGFTQKSAKKFFGLIKENKVKRLLDVRLNNVSQLAGFAKKNDLAFFLDTLCGSEYIHLPDLAPEKSDLNAYKKGEMIWDRYEDIYLNLMSKRGIEKDLTPSLFEDGCLLCSEHLPHHCHRRLVVEYLNEYWGKKLEVIHLV